MFEVLGVEVNVLAIVLAMIAQMIFGMLWYGPLFEKQWLALVGKTKEEAQMKPQDIGLSLLMSLLIATGLNSILQFAQQVSDLDLIENILLSAAMVAFTITLPIYGNQYIWAGRNIRLLLLDWTHFFLTYIIVNIVLSFFIY